MLGMAVYTVGRSGRMGAPAGPPPGQLLEFEDLVLVASPPAALPPIKSGSAASFYMLFTP